MSDTKIEWATSVWNPVTGCTPIAAGCQNCYAARIAKWLAGRCGYPADDPFRVTLRPERLTEPLLWKNPRRVFVASMGDLFHESVPFEFIDRVFAVMNATTLTLPISPDSSRWHKYLILTKRPDRMSEYLAFRSPGNLGDDADNPIFVAGRSKGGVLRGHGLELMNAGAMMSWPLPNVWVGTSCSTQSDVDHNVPHLLRCPAAVRFLSLEPLLGPIDLNLFHRAGVVGDSYVSPGNHWVIVGGESGPHARPCHLDWIRSIVRQCEDAGVPCFVKQLGAAAIDETNGLAGRSLRVPGDSAPLILNRLRDPKGGDMAEWPEDVRVRQYPEVAR